MSKLKFSFEVKPTEDGKSNFIALTLIQTEEDKTFSIPEVFQSTSLHKEISSSNNFARVKNTLKKRYQRRSVWITLTEDMKKAYYDDDGNIIFQDEYLEEIKVKNPDVDLISDENNSMVKILRQLEEGREKNKKQNVRKIAERFVLEKFDGKSNVNAYQWMEFFEKECTRFDIDKDEEKVEIFRIFLDKSCLEWYNSMILKFTLQSEWSEWKRTFCHTFERKGWSAGRYALAFKYQTGSLLDYAIRKERLMLEVSRTIDPGTLIQIIAAGLPTFITDRINKEDIFETRELFNEIDKLEHLVTKNEPMKEKHGRNLKMDRKQKCSMCEK